MGGNGQNGSFPYKIETDNFWDLVLNISGNPNGEFGPQLFIKGQRMIDKLEEAITGMYSRGMTTSDSYEQVNAIYGVDVSEGTISNVTNRLIEHVKEWQNRPLESVYFTVWMDGIVLKVRQNGKYINKCIFIVIGLKNDGL
jgi:putative transposase